MTETNAAFDMAAEVGWDSIISTRSGETEDVTIVHLAVGWGAKQMKVGSFARSERVVKWNEGPRIAEAIGTSGLRTALETSGKDRNRNIQKLLQHGLALIFHFGKGQAAHQRH